MDPPSTAPTVEPAESRAFKRWLRKASLVSGIGLGLTAEEREHNLEEQKHLMCEKWKTQLMNYSELPGTVETMRRRPCACEDDSAHACVFVSGVAATAALCQAQRWCFS